MDEMDDLSLDPKEPKDSGQMGRIEMMLEKICGALGLDEGEEYKEGPMPEAAEDEETYA
jgi:hypothetical protein